MDTPFAQARWCGAEGVSNVQTLSDFRDRDFAARMRLHARSAIRVTGPGLRELAEDWNRAHAADSR